MPFHIVHNDITKMNVDVIVNAANNQLLQGGGVCGAIFKTAGEKLLQRECSQYAPIQTGQAVITNGYNLSAKYIIHAVGPIYKDGQHNEKELLISAYKSSLMLAIKHNCQSIALPLISSGIYGYPKKEALAIATSTINDFLSDSELDVYLVVFDKDSVTLSESLYQNIEHYIDQYFIEDRYTRRIEVESNYSFNAPKTIKKKTQSQKRHIVKYFFEEDEMEEELPHIETSRSLDDLVNMLDETFSEMLLRLIDEKGYTDTQVYKRANIDRKLFSKIRTQADYHPSKKTALALCIALQLSLDETIDLLNKAGYTLSNSQKRDIIIRYFIENNDYNIYTINEALFFFNQPTL